ncbi:MAG: tRNA lysidine(34) synthetase TilS [Armatimonadetes bacterium]|nr:tRNA lysidine(34) synthetase TilS [Armatimonadota bacterium]
MTGARGILETKLIAAVERHGMLSPGDRVLLALSGGQDSLALLHCLHRLGPELSIDLEAAHLNHGIRGEEADEDQRFVEALCEKWGVPLAVARVDVPAVAKRDGISLEQAGRAERYAFLRRVAAERDCRRIALAHTATDRAETVLMNILRGAGLGGLRGIAAVNGEVIRPLIEVTREETAEYCAEHGLQPRHDRTNEDTGAHLRNRVRLELMPLLARNYAPGIEDCLLRLAKVVEGELEWTREAENAAYSDLAHWEERGLGLLLAPLQEMPQGLARRMVRRAIGDVVGSLEGFTLQHVDAVLGLAAQGRTGARVQLPGGYRAERGYERLLMSTGCAMDEEPGPWEVTLQIPGAVALPPGGKVCARTVPVPGDPRACGACEAYLDFAAIGSTVCVRSRRPGDRMQLVGMSGSRKLQDLMVDRKIPRQERDRVPVVLNSRGEIVWVGGCGVSRTGAIHERSAAAVHIRWLGC